MASSFSPLSPSGSASIVIGRAGVRACTYQAIQHFERSRRVRSAHFLLFDQNDYVGLSPPRERRRSTVRPNCHRSRSLADHLGEGQPLFVTRISTTMTSKLPSPILSHSSAPP